MDRPRACGCARKSKLLGEMYRALSAKDKEFYENFGQLAADRRTIGERPFGPKAPTAWS